MPKLPNVSVVVPVRDAGTGLKPLVRALDAQDLPYAGYRVIFVDLGSTDGTAERLAELAAHRPNVEVLTADDRGVGWRSAVGRAETDFVVLIDPEDRLQPWALSAMLQQAADNGLDVVLGRTALPGPVGFVPESITQPWRRDDPDAAAALLTPIALVRTDLLRESLSSPDAGWRASRVKLLAATDAIGTLVDPPVGRGAGPSAGETAEEIWRDADAAAHGLDGTQRARFIAAHAAATVRRDSDLSASAELITEVVRRHAKDTDISTLAPAHRGVLAALLDSEDTGRGIAAAVAATGVWAQVKINPTVTSASWRDGNLTLRLRIEVAAGGAGLPDGFADVVPILLVRNPANAADYEMPAEVSVRDSGVDPTRTFELATELDIATAAGGAWLSKGMWRVWVRLSGTGSDAPISTGVPYVPTGGAIIDGVPVKPYDDNRQLALDIGAAKHGIFAHAKPTDATVDESAAGSLLTLRLLDVAVRGEATLPGKLYQGKFALPATLRADADGARIECYVSGLAGVSKLSGHFTPAMQQDLGLRLRIGGAGDFALETITSAKKSAAKKPAPVKPAAKPAPGKPAAKKPAPVKKAAAEPDASATSKKPGGGTTAKPYPAAHDSPNLAQRVLPVFKPVGRLLPLQVRKRARRAYRKLIK